MFQYYILLMVIINQWMQSYRLSLTIEKTNYMIFSHPHKKIFDQSIELYLNGDSVSRVNDITFLGVIIDENMSWRPHTEYISTKVSKTIGILLRARQMIYGHTLQLLYNALIKPHFTYGITIWGNTFKKYIQ